MQDFSWLGYLTYLLQAVINYLQFNNLLLLLLLYPNQELIFHEICEMNSLIK